MKKLLILSMFLLSSCATILSSKTQNVSLVSEDGDNLNATVSTIKGTKKVSLPGTVALTRDERPITIKVDENACYQQSVTRVDPKTIRTFNPWFFLNVITAGLPVGSITDYATGAMWKYEDPIVVQTNKKSSCR